MILNNFVLQLIAYSLINLGLILKFIMEKPKITIFHILIILLDITILLIIINNRDNVSFTSLSMPL